MFRQFSGVVTPWATLDGYCLARGTFDTWWYFNGLKESNGMHVCLLVLNRNEWPTDY